MNNNKKTIKALITTMLAGVLTAGLPFNTFADTALPKDLDKIKSSGAQSAIKEMYEKGKLGGFSDNTFRPDQKVTRAEFTAMVLRALDAESLDSGIGEGWTSFADSKEGDWHFETIRKAHNLGLISGKGVNMTGVIIKPNDPITREEMLTILVRAYELENGKKDISSNEVTSKLAKFTDANKLPSWAKGAVAKSLNYGITSGLSNTTIGAGEKGTRLQSAVFSHRVLKQTEAKNPESGNPTTGVPGDVVKEDKTAPVITLKGNKDVTLYEGDVFADNGVTANDNVDGEITSLVKVSGDTVNTSKAGNYVVKYNVSDKAGNAAGEVTRNVVVKEAVAKLEAEKEIIQIKKSGTTVGAVRDILSERHSINREGIHFVKAQPVIDSEGNAIKAAGISTLFVNDSHTKVDGKFTKSTLYTVAVDTAATDVQINPSNKTIVVNDTHTLSDVKNALETKAAAIIGENSAEFFMPLKDTEVVYGDTTALIEDADHNVVVKNVTYVFGDALVVESGENSLTIQGLKFEDLVDLYTYNPNTKDKVKMVAGAEVGVNGTYTFKNLNTGFYVVVQQPVELGKAGEKNYDDEYQKRLKNETVHEIKTQFKVERNTAGQYRLSANNSDFALTNTDSLIDFVKEEQKVAKINGGGDLYAEVVYENRTDRVKFKNIQMNFGTENVDVDNNSATPDVTFPTVALNPTADYEQFALNQSVKFTLVLKDKDATGAVTSKVEIPLQATVVLKNAALAVEVTPQ